ncbi:MAG: sporulation integral membrane protein YtvI [Ruminococcaceae bacterium]|nr:sporulation integral membrane protein YtvI [Oscillospiraceae bacterium]
MGYIVAYYFHLRKGKFHQIIRGADSLHSKTSTIINKLLLSALSLAGIWLALRFLFPLAAPMLLAFAAAVVIEPAVKFLCRKHFPRSAASGLCALAFPAIVGILLWLLLSRIFSEFQHLSARLPEFLKTVSDFMGYWQERLGSLSLRLPPVFTQVLESTLAGAKDYLFSLPGTISGKILSRLTAAAANAPIWLLFAVTWIMGLYFISAAYPSIMRFLRFQISHRSFERLRRIKSALGESLGKYLKAQLIMSAITFGEMLIVFALLRVDYALVLATAVAVIDALPVFGAGTVLLPWAAWEFIAGDASRGLGLAISYAAVTVLRNCIQAKLLGDQLGLHPAVTLLAIYSGAKAMGVTGMIVFPIAAISIKKLNDSGLIHIWKREDTNDRNNIQYNCGNGHEHSGGHEYPSG